MTNLNNVVGAKYFSPKNNHDKSGRKMFRPYSHFILKILNKKLCQQSEPQSGSN